MMKEGEIVLLKNFLSKDITSFLRQHVLKCHQRFLMGCKQQHASGASTKAELRATS